MIEVLLLIGFWLIYIFINTAVSVMSKDSLFFVLAHGTLFIIFVGLRWLLQVYLNEQYAMRRYLNHSDISLVTDLMSWDVLGTMVVLIIVCIVIGWHHIRMDCDCNGGDSDFRRTDQCGIDGFEDRRYSHCR